jgi:MoxR-like ATPase
MSQRLCNPGGSARALPRTAPSMVTTRRIQRLGKGQAGAFRRIVVHGSSRERDVNMQLDTLKEETKSAYAEAIDRVKGLAAASHGHDSESPAASRDSSSLQYRLSEAIRELSHGLIEREVEVRLLLLAALSQEHLLLLGPPGTAKSELGRRYAFDPSLSSLAIGRGNLSRRAASGRHSCPLT